MRCINFVFESAYIYFEQATGQYGRQGTASLHACSAAGAQPLLHLARGEHVGVVNTSCTCTCT